MKQKTAISVEGLSKEYQLYEKRSDRLKEIIFKKKYHRKFKVIDDISFDIKKGEIVGIVGVNGAGKSTLLKIISGVVKQTAGKVKVFGSLNAILELGTGLNSELTGRENIKNALLIEQKIKCLESSISDVIEFADIGLHIDQPVKTYSSGMKARLSFALAVVTSPDILIVDEVLAVGDLKFQRKCYAKMESLFKDGKTVIFVSHSSQSVIDLCQRAILLYDKKIILDSNPKQVIEVYQKLLFSNSIEEKKQIINSICNKKNEACNSQFLKGISVESKSINSKYLEFKKTKIVNKKGEAVNKLQPKNRYSIEFDVECKTNLEKIYVGAQIKSLKGVLISGCNSYELNGEYIEKLEPGDKLKVSISFNNHLLTGTYVIMLFCRDQIDFFASLEDAIAFKVDTYGFNQGGLVSLDQSIRYQYG